MGARDQANSSDTSSTSSKDGAGAWIGRVIDNRYKIVKVLGEGGMGAVFVAEHLKLQMEVAFKIIRPQFADDPTFMARFNREAMATAKIDNPHIASAMDFGALPEGGAYFVSQLVRGRDLRSMIHREGAMPWPRACEICSHIADALVTAHAAGIVHRDLKPENVLVEIRDDGSPLARVLDFGIARLEASEEESDDAAPLTRVGTVVGTPGYMAPEQAVGAVVDARSDLYALGVILWECVAGRSLWRAETLTELFTMQLRDPAPSLQSQEIPGLSAADGLPVELVAIVDKLLERNIEDRPESATPVRQTLRQLAALGSAASPSLSPVSASGGALASRPTPHAPTTIPDSAGTLAVAAATIQQDPTTRRALKGLAIFVVVTALLGVVLALIFGGEAKQEAASGGGLLASLTQSGVPEELEDALESIAKDESLTKRRKAAKKIKGYKPKDDVPEFAAQVAELELSRECGKKKKYVVKLGELGDSRALPALKRMEESRASCGRVFKRDCFECLRDELEVAIDKLD